MESGLLSLRAELHKKKSQLNKQHEININHKPKPLYKEPKKPRDKEYTKKNEALGIDDEERLKLEKSRKTLEKKALLYDQIKNGTKVLEDDELNERFLIDFQKKIYKEVSESKESQEKLSTEEKPTLNEEDTDPYEAKNPSDEWVEYTDSFNRTRMCLKKDVEYMKGKVETGKTQNVLREKWGKVEEDSKTKSDIHYQDVLFDEARSHGTSFMPFSRDEVERKAQQQLLKDIESTATKIVLSKDALKRKRQKLMEERLAKVRQKKRLKMGLPVKDDDRYKTPPASDEEDAITEEVKEVAEAVSEAISKDDDSESREKYVREWDIGKPGVSSIMSQTQWIESRRKERENEFAPPVNYSNHNRNYESKTNSFSFQGSCKKTDTINRDQEERCSEFSPPATYEYFRPLSTKKNFSFKPNVDIEAAITKGLAQIRNDYDKREG